MEPKELYRRLKEIDMPLTTEEWDKLLKLFEDVSAGITGGIIKRRWQ